jgi:NhaA family Na+:H+ antiporter
MFSITLALRKHLNSSFVLIFVTISALIFANSPWNSLYFEMWQTPVAFQIGAFNLFSHGGHPMTLMEFTNDFLMAIFFFSVGLEIKREILVGELSNPKKALLPIIGAVGGMAIPVLTYLIFSQGGDALRGASIPMATDIAFSLGVLAMLGSRVPVGLKIFLAALAVADDLGGIIVIAFMHSGALNLFFLGLASLVIISLLFAARNGLRSKLIYCLAGLLIWSLFLNSGIHATIAGVIVAFCIPARPKTTSKYYVDIIRQNVQEFPQTNESKGEIHILTNSQIAALKRIESASDKVISPLQDLEDSLHGIVLYFIVPLFAFVNAGVDFAGMSLLNLFSGVGLSVFAGLVLGKFIGIFTFSWLAVKFKVVELPTHTNWKMMAGIALLGGIGFTVSMFMANLAFDGDTPQMYELLNNAKLAILVGSVFSGVAGYCVLKRYLPQTQENVE